MLFVYLMPHSCNVHVVHTHLLEVTKQQMCMKYLFKWFVLPVAGLVLKYWYCINLCQSMGS